MMLNEQPTKKNQWYLASTKVKDEIRALTNLENQDINAYIPTRTIEKIKRGKKALQSEILFPGYIFIQLDFESNNFSKVRSTRGIRDWIRFNSYPAKVEDELIQNLRSYQSYVVGGSQMPDKGDQIKVEIGAFVKHHAIYQMQDGTERSIVLIKLLGQQHTLSIENSRIITK